MQNLIRLERLERIAGKRVGRPNRERIAQEATAFVERIREFRAGYGPEWQNRSLAELTAHLSGMTMPELRAQLRDAEFNQRKSTA